MFRSHESEKLNTLSEGVRGLASFFRFRRKPLREEATQTLQELDESFIILKSEEQKLSEHLSSCTLELKEANEQNGNLNKELKGLEQQNLKLKKINEQNLEFRKEYQALSTKQWLTRTALSAAPISDENFLEYRRLYEDEFLPFANKEDSLAEEAQAIEDLRKVEQELELISQFSAIKQRRIIAVGGGFSAGKSQFLSSFVQDEKIELPIGIRPATAFPTYIISGTSNTIRGFASNGGPFEISSDMFRSLDHEFIDSLGFNLRKIMPNVTMETPLAYPEGEKTGQDIQHICFIDTPGYNAASSHAAEDKDISLPYLEEADVLLWLIGLDSNGTIPKTDRDLLEGLELEEKGKKLYIIANKADCKSSSDIEMIVEKIVEELEDREIPFEGLSAFASVEKREYLFQKKSLLDFLSEQDKELDTSHKIFGKIVDVLYRYRDALQKEINDIYHIFAALKGIELDLLKAAEIDLDISEGIQKVRERFDEKTLREYLGDLKRIGEKMLAAAATIMGGNEIPTLEIDTKYKPRKVQEEKEQAPKTIEAQKEEQTRDKLQELKAKPSSGELQRILCQHEGWLRGAGIEKANLSNTNLENMDLQNADLRKVNLRNANLQGANLRGASLQGASLHGANLQGANLYGASLQAADLQGANLQGADLWAANLEGANLEGANLKGAILPRAFEHRELASSLPQENL